MSPHEFAHDFSEIELVERNEASDARHEVTETFAGSKVNVEMTNSIEAGNSSSPKWHTVGDGLTATQQ